MSTRRAAVLKEQVSAELGLSRTPVREAMRTLEREHLLVAERSGGMRVAESDPGTLLAAYELREVVDGLAARLAAGRGAAGVADQFGEVLLQQESLLVGPWSPERWVRSDIRFHGLVMEASNNSYLLGLVPFVQATNHVFRRLACCDATARPRRRGSTRRSPRRCSPARWSRPSTRPGRTCAAPPTR